VTARRDFLAFTAGAVAAHTVLPLAAKAAPVSPDARLIAYCREAIAIDNEAERLWTVYIATESKEADAAFMAHTKATNARWHDLVRAISSIPAITFEGMKAKAEVAQSAVPQECRSEPNPCDRLAWSVMDDVLGSKPFPLPERPDNPDAALLAACADLMAADIEKARIDRAPGVSDDEITSAVNDWMAALDRVTELPATTLEGAKAKSRAVIAAFKFKLPQMRGQTVESEAEYHEIVAWRLALDFVAMGAGG
jgi:hypothetical protein